MSVEMYMKMDGITGESNNYLYKGWSEVSSWSWGMSNDSSPELLENIKPVFKELAITKRIGRDSAGMMLHFAQGKQIKTVEFVIAPIVAKKEAKLKYLTMHMEDVLIKSISTGGDISETQFNEDILLCFSKVRFEYSFNIVPTQEHPAGSSTDHKFGWDIGMNQQWQSTPVPETA